MVRVEGWHATLRHTIRHLAGVRSFPLAGVEQRTLLATDIAEVRRAEKDKGRHFSTIVSGTNVESSYPEVYEADGRFLRFAHLPAKNESLGLVVSFHGHDAHLILSRSSAWENFDVLAPWDTFGWHRQGSWFWGEKGTAFVETLVQGLIAKIRGEHPERPWFCVGGSMGGFGALYHGIKHGASGVYVMCPQVDLRLKVKEYGEESPDNPYGYLLGVGGAGSFPDLLAVAEEKEALPPLFLVQNQYDSVNPFATHGFRLLDVYNRKKGWYGVRIHPAIGHGGDGSEWEAEFFFSMITRKQPPFRFP